MNNISLTDEQLSVIHHPLGQHARVLAVAGSGKSFTMACRIQHLVQDCHVPPHAIRVLMFNRLAREQFRAHLERTGLPEAQQPDVHTFHSFSFQVINTMIRLGVLPGLTQFWTGEKEELIWLIAKRAIESLERQHLIPPNEIEAEEALNAISLWKSALLPPERAGSWSMPKPQRVYAEFERMRLEKSALTFDDFIPLAIELLETNASARHRWCAPVQYLIVDEYQDVNRGQQRLLELLSHGTADVMVVGDDDQTIYEWRGARPNYILRDFEQAFNHKPHQLYRLSRSFRFGPAIALLWSSNPELIGQINLSRWVLQQSAVPKTTTEGCGGNLPTAVPNNTWGWGRLGIYAAVTLARAGGVTPDWLSVTPQAGEVAPDGSQLVTLNFHPSLDMFGTYTATLWIVADDPLNSDVRIPVTLTVGQASFQYFYFPLMLKTPTE